MTLKSLVGGKTLEKLETDDELKSETGIEVMGRMYWKDVYAACIWHLHGLFIPSRWI